VLGFGDGNLKDSKLEKLADNGNGNYAYIDNLKEARKVLVEQAGGSLITIAKDVKLQLEFNPAHVKGYRLIGYENRMLAAQDFDDDTKDAGEIGAGHTVTAIYELIPAGSDETIPAAEEGKPGEAKPEGEAKPKDAAKPADAPQAAADASPHVQPLKYQRTSESSDQSDLSPAPQSPRLTKAAESGELLTLALRYKQPEGTESTRLEFTLPAKSQAFSKSSKDFQFAASVASFGMLLRHSKHAGSATYAAVEEIAGSALGDDREGRRAEFLDLVRTAERLAK
jgi:Ca-activated chloride channel family protein